MATSTKWRDLLAVDLALPTCFTAHCFIWIVAGWISTVTVGASQALLGVDVLAEFLLGHAQGFRQGGVTIQAGVLSLAIA